MSFVRLPFRLKFRGRIASLMLRPTISVSFDSEKDSIPALAYQQMKRKVEKKNEGLPPTRDIRR